MNCDDYLQDPETYAAHLETCATCRAMFEELDIDLPIQHRPIDVNALPLANWEGASQRTWPLVAAGLLAVIVLASVLFIAAGTSPLRGIAKALVSAVPSLDLMVNLSQLAGGALHNAPVVWHVAIAVSFVLINTVLFLLLRRSPKGVVSNDV
ncbi:MAG: hypothetical protein ACTHQM_21605 [Thermoanaerobaculia bacterium]|jgi:hypothetical protein